MRNAATLALIIAATITTASAQVCSETPTSLTTLPGPSGCSQCSNTLLPGTLNSSPDTSFTIISDLPEVFCGNGLLYSTTPVLPADVNSAPSLSMRTQNNPGNAFQFITGPFEVFLFHSNFACTNTQTARRIVVYVKNEGTGPISINPKQIIRTDGIIGNVHEMESTLGGREFQENWDTPISSVTIQPGTGQVVAYSKRFRDSANNSDRSTGSNCFGRVRTAVTNANAGTSPTQLHVSLVAIPGIADLTQNTSLAETHMVTGALSGDSQIDMQSPPWGCQTRRACGVYSTFIWRNNPLTMDISALSGNVSFQMALWGIASGLCPSAKQTANLLLYPKYVREDTVGNYHAIYRTKIRLINKDAANTRTVDLQFGKDNADVGLAWQVASGTTAPSDATVDAAPVRTSWAGPNQSGLRRSFLTDDGGNIVLGPCSAREVSIKFMVLGNSSLPYVFDIVPIGQVGIVVDNTDAESTRTSGWSASANAGFYGTNSLIGIGPSGTNSVFWTPSLPSEGYYQVDAWWVASSNRATAAPYFVGHRNGVTAVPQNQTTNGSAWISLGTFPFNAGSTGYVELRNPTSGAEYSSADAIRWTYQSALPVSLTRFSVE